MFSHAQGSEVLLDGSSAVFGSSVRNENNHGVGIGNGYGNETTSSSTFDLSDFPSLGGVGAGNSSGGSGGSNSSNNGLAAILRQQQLLAAQQQMLSGSGNGNGGKGGTSSSNLYRLAMSSSTGAPGAAGSNFNMAAEDFPALPGAPPPSQGLLGGTGMDAPPRDSSGTATTLSNSSSFGLTSSTGPPPGSTPVRNSTLSGANGNGNSGALYSTDLDGTSTLGQHSASRDSTGLQLPANNSSTLVSLQNLGQQQQSNSQLNPHNQTQPRGVVSSTSSASGGASSVSSALSGDYGLLGLLSVIRMADADRNALALGSDLTTLGLNLNAPEGLCGTFGGPFSDEPAEGEPHYQLPMCYYMQPPALKTGHLSKFQLETLFYIFYALPKDVLQAYAAQELYTREWRYHVESKLWFKRATPSDNSSASSGGGNGQFIYFDNNTWERRVYGSVNTNIAAGFLPEDDVRVKFPSS